jgi:hypothetical protein
MIVFANRHICWQPENLTNLESLQDCGFCDLRTSYLCFIVVYFSSRKYLVVRESWEGDQTGWLQLPITEQIVVPPTEYITAWQRPLSGAHSIMIEKLAQTGGTPFYSIYHHGQSCRVRSSWEGRYITLFQLYPYALFGSSLYRITSIHVHCTYRIQRFR